MRTKIIANVNDLTSPTINAPATDPKAPPVITYTAILLSTFLLCVIAPIEDEKGITNRLIAKAVNRCKPARLSNGILTEPPPIPNIPLIKPAIRPTPKRITNWMS